MIPGKRALAGMAALVAAIVLATVFGLPPQPVSAPVPAWRSSSVEARGVFHVHTRRSDGTGTVEEVAAAAARAGLQFVIYTDHGDATRQPDAPVYRSGVLCIDAVEISTTGGHYAALGLGAAPYPLAGEPQDVADDVRRMGGFGIVTHPLSPKADLAWRGWDVAFDGIEWLNGDSVWRDAPLSRLARAGWTYPFRPLASLARLYQRPGALTSWDSLTRGRRVVVLAGTDAHARLGFREGAEPYANPVYLRLPSYEAAFEMASLRVRLTTPLTRSAARDAESILTSIRNGHLHTVVDALAQPAAFEMTATSGTGTAGEGDILPFTDPVVVRVRANIPGGGWIVLFRDGVQVHRVAVGDLVYASDRPGGYRAEVWLPAPGRDAFVPWVVGNPIYVGSVAEPSPAPVPDMTGPTFWLETGEPLWDAERSPGSRAALDRQGGGIALRYSLAGGSEAAPFAALSATTRIDSRATGIALRGSSERPMRISVQVRIPNGAEGERWRRSVYLDSTVREVVVPFSSMLSTDHGPNVKLTPRLGEVRTVLFVVDTVNARPGTSGRFVLDEVRLFSPDLPSR